MRHDPLELAEENFTYQLQRALARVARGEGTGDTLASIAMAYRVLAICALLRNADSERFARLLCKSGQVRLHLLERVPLGLKVPAPVLAVSNDVGFCAALAGGDLVTATKIAAHSPRARFEGWEDEEDFLFFHFLQQLLRAPSEADPLLRLLDRWNQVVDGDVTPFFSVCQALLGSDAYRFSTALGEMVEARKDNLRKYRKQLDFDPELHATEGKVYLNGLALIRLAESRGIPACERYELLPRPALMARCPTLSEDAWRSP
ncbi:immunity 49 family protein [Pyxidicoccus parkwayensis]|uniref:Immunity 49 family protein n=1 Tax=Pyxidicoccus parkwayensis TaxID=2813578 RepID=A0ABX7P861_9BACT|nr:Imm49 family immunity protein [Pyxidicoccus parkwaysis]QSQ26647.1 immunity 49 family protein [Pyxidicoccus parkwaysis]